MAFSSGRTGWRPARFFLPRSHRLYAVFSGFDEALAALNTLPPELGRPDAWVFVGADGAIELDPDTVTGPGRAFSWLFSHNVEDLKELSRLVAAGWAVVAVRQANIAQAEQTAALLKALGGQWFAYTAHGNFVPVVPQH